MGVRSFAVLGLFATHLFASAQTPAKPRLDAHGFPLPHGAVARLGDLHFAQQEWISVVAISPDGKVVASAGGGIFLWNATTGRITREISYSRSVSNLVFTKNGKLVAAVTNDGEISVWNTLSGKAQLKPQGGKPRWECQVTGAQFIQQDQLLAVARNENEAQTTLPRTEFHVQLWDAKKGTLKKTWAVDETKRKQLKSLGPNHEYAWVALSPSGEQMAWLIAPNAGSGGANEGACAVFIYETVTGKLLREIRGLRGPVERIVLCDEGTNVLLQSIYRSPAGNENQQVNGKLEGSHRLIQAINGQIRFSFDYRHRVEISQFRPSGFAYAGLLNSSSDGKSLLAQDDLGIVRWDLATGKVQDEFPNCNSLAFTATGKCAVVARGSRWQLSDEKLQPLQPTTEFSEGPHVHYLSNGKLVAQSWSPERLNVWDAAQGKIVESRLRVPAPPVGRNPCTYDSSGKLFVYCSKEGVVVCDLVADRTLCKLEIGDFESVWAVFPVLSSDGTRVLVAVLEKDHVVVRWFETQTGRELGEYKIARKVMFPQPYWPVRWFTSDGSVFGYTAPDSRLVLVDCGRKDICLRLGMAVPLPNLADDRTLVFPEWSYETAGFDRFIVACRRSGNTEERREYCIWDRVTGQRMRRFYLKPDGWNARWGALLSPDGRTMAVIPHDNERRNEIRFYETATGGLRGTITAPCRIQSFDFAPDGKTAATSCSDTTILIWDLGRSLIAGKSAPLGFSE